MLVAGGAASLQDFIAGDGASILYLPRRILLTASSRSAFFRSFIRWRRSPDWLFSLSPAASLPRFKRDFFIDELLDRPPDLLRRIAAQHFRGGL